MCVCKCDRSERSDVYVYESIVGASYSDGEICGSQGRVRFSDLSVRKSRTNTIRKKNGLGLAEWSLSKREKRIESSKPDKEGDGLDEDGDVTSGYQQCDDAGKKTGICCVCDRVGL